MNRSVLLVSVVSLFVYCLAGCASDPSPDRFPLTVGDDFYTECVAGGPMGPFKDEGDCYQHLDGWASGCHDLCDQMNGSISDRCHDYISDRTSMLEIIACDLPDEPTEAIDWEEVRCVEQCADSHPDNAELYEQCVEDDCGIQEANDE